MTYKTYLVGGAVRDLYMRRNEEIKDRDFVVVGAKPEDLLSQGYEQVGKDFPVFLHPETRYEYALARVERKIGEGYHGFACDVHGVSIEDDLERRDLTINSMAIDETSGNLIDPFNGIQDIRDRVLRHTSPAFAEDPLRVIRLARFAARFVDYGFSVAPETRDLAIQMVESGELQSISNERFWLEFEKAFSDHRPAHFIKTLSDFGVFSKVPYFTSLFGVLSETDLKRMMAFASAAKSTSADAEAALTMFAGFFMKPNDVLKNTRVQRLCEANTQYWSFHEDMNAENVVSLLSKMRAWGQLCETFDDLLLVLSAFEKMVGDSGENRSSVLLKRCAQAGRAVYADMFPDVQGPALGQAMKAAREDAIKLILKK